MSAMACRAHQQKVARMSHVGFIVKKLSHKLSTPEHQKRMVTTNRLLPLGSLKRKCLKQLFRGWVKRRFKGCGRILTKKVAEATVRRLRSKLELPDCLDLEDEINRMHYFLKVARKRLGTGKEKAMSTMDALETLPMEQCNDDKEFYGSLMEFCREDCLFVFMSSIIIYLPQFPINNSLFQPWHCQDTGSEAIPQDPKPAAEVSRWELEPWVSGSKGIGVSSSNVG